MTNIENDGNYDVLIPGSGGKDSVWVSYTKHKFKMIHFYSNLGTSYVHRNWMENFSNWVHSGFDNYLFTPNPTIHRKLTRLAFENLLHPFQPLQWVKLIFSKNSSRKKHKFNNVRDAQAEKAEDGDLWNEGASTIHLYSHTKIKTSSFLGELNIEI